MNILTLSVLIKEILHELTNHQITKEHALERLIDLTESFAKKSGQ